MSRVGRDVAESVAGGAHVSLTQQELSEDGMQPHSSLGETLQVPLKKLHAAARLLLAMKQSSTERSELGCAALSFAPNSRHWSNWFV